ncbi:hypothetical protein JKP88DRAFT_181157 [Tribonema minus]|uniref:Uncharacterized protein n=1 Tax=Tribonema minus TaxID=303371 RepID=A0A835Z3V7_9STRA|nr:hypothetical protein JKP88DRAFT_181157 [Tribonema minus]
MLVRRLQTTRVDLSHAGMGDQLGALLAACLADLPCMRALSLRDNRLTDAALLPVVRAIRRRNDLQELDLSENVCGGGAAAELAAYFSDRGVCLRTLMLSAADLDDGEASKFVEQLRHNTSLTHLDLSRNLIGKQESVNYVNPAFYTGAEALADWLAMPQCRLRHLDVSWNTIRLGSAISFGEALARNASLHTLLLGYNGFGAAGGEAIGAALCRNTALRKMDLTANSISPRAAVVIAEGLIANKGLREVALGQNPLGKQGARWVTRLPGEMVGEGGGGALDIDVSGSNFQIEDTRCWFDDDKVKLKLKCLLRWALHTRQ